ncbi:MULTISPECIES: hypothetical protein [unclassified Luteococcus]|uniref:hypothetical protein n=1 Tax=unclassified Luteococcus TaxID=2639923 RepID=UPI00313B0BDF
MKNTLTIPVVLVTLTLLFTVLPDRPVTLLSVGVALIAAAAFEVGAWLAPPWKGPVKSLQLVGGGLASAAAMLLFTQNPGMAALIGIVAALMIGALAAGSARGKAEAAE